MTSMGPVADSQLSLAKISNRKLVEAPMGGVPRGDCQKPVKTYIGPTDGRYRHKPAKGIRVANYR